MDAVRGRYNPTTHFLSYYSALIAGCHFLYIDQIVKTVLYCTITKELDARSSRRRGGAYYEA